MKDKIKLFSKKYLLGFTLGLISGSLVMVYAETYFPSNQTTYDNSATGMSATDVQGAIDELYNVCFPPKTGGEWVLDNTDIVISGDGLYEDEYEEGKYTYKGANPNNYVTFNNETAGWRIISINSDGTIKIMRNSSIGNMDWDSSGSNNWNNASLKSYLNGNYYNSLTSTAQGQITANNFSIGAVTYANNDLADQINDENGTTWNGKVALATASENLRANSNVSSCESQALILSKYDTCRNTTWMFNSETWWLLSLRANDTDRAFYMYFNGNSGNTNHLSTSIGVRPVVYLSSEVKITGGDGSQSNPYTIE